MITQLQSLLLAIITNGIMFGFIRFTIYKILT